MSNLRLSGILAVALCAGLIEAAEADSPTTRPRPPEPPGMERFLEQDPLGETADWLLDRADPRQRAAGLLYRLSLMGRLHTKTFDGSSLIEALKHTIRASGDGAALAWLARACSDAGIQDSCIDQGLDAAIIAYDAANVFSRMALRDDPSIDEFRRLLVESSSTMTYEPELAGVWFDALQRGTDFDFGIVPSNELGTALVMRASAIPMVPAALFDACASSETTSAPVTVACSRIIEDMTERGRSAATRFMGLLLLAKRAEARGNVEAANQYRAALSALKDRYYCLSSGLSNSVDRADPKRQRDYLRWLSEDGEIGVLERQAELAGLDCSDPPDVRSKAVTQAGTDPAADS